MCQNLNLSWKIVAQNAGCVFVHFCGGHKNNSRNSFKSFFHIFVVSFSAGGAEVQWLSLLHNFIQLSLNSVLSRFKPNSRRFGNLRWWGSLTMVPVGNKAKRLSSVNHTTKTIHHHHHHHHHHHQQWQQWNYLCLTLFVASAARCTILKLRLFVQLLLKIDLESSKSRLFENLQMH